MKIFIISDFLFCIDVIPPLSKHVKTLVPFSYLPCNLRWVKDQSTQEMVRCGFFAWFQRNHTKRKVNLTRCAFFESKRRISAPCLPFLKAERPSCCVDPSSREATRSDAKVWFQRNQAKVWFQRNQAKVWFQRNQAKRPFFCVDPSLIHLLKKDGLFTCLSNKGSTGLDPF